MTASGSPVSRAECLFTMRSKIDANLRSILLTLASVSRSAIQRASRANAVIASISDALYIDGCLSETKVSADCIADPGGGPPGSAGPIVGKVGCRIFNDGNCRIFYRR